MDEFSLSLRSLAAHERDHKGNDNLAALLDQAADEIERLRAALKHISELGPEGEEQPCDPESAMMDSGDSDFNLYDQGFCEAWRRAGNLAREALNQQLTGEKS